MTDIAKMTDITKVFVIIAFVSATLSVKVHANVLRVNWYKIKTNKSATGYMSKTLAFSGDKFKIETKIYNYDKEGYRIHEIVSVSDKTFNPIYYEHIIKRSKNPEENITIKTTFQDNVLTKTKTTVAQTFTRQDIIPPNTILKDFLYLVLLNDDLKPKIKAYNVLDNHNEAMLPKIEHISLEEKQADNSQRITFKTSFGYTQMDKLGKIIFESNFNQSLSLVRDMEALRNYFKVL